MPNTSSFLQKNSFFRKHKLSIGILGITLICSIGLFFSREYLNTFAPNLNAGINRHPLWGECVSIDFPAVVTGGEEYSGTVTFRNTGSEVWKPITNGDGITVVILQQKNPGWSHATQWAGTFVDTNISPGGTFTFSFTVKAPDWFPDGVVIPLPLILGSLSRGYIAPACTFETTIKKRETYDIELIKDVSQPVWDANYARLNPLGGGNDVFMNIRWLPSGYFAVSGWCNDAMHANSRIQVDRGDQESGGLYVLTEDGTFSGLANVCRNTSSPVRDDCFHDSGCRTGLEHYDMGGGRILSTLDASVTVFPIHRGSAMYDINHITDEGVLIPEKIHYSLDNGSTGNVYYEGDETRQVQWVVYANGKMVGVETTDAGKGPYAMGNKKCRTNSATFVYDLPSFSEVDKKGYTLLDPDCPGNKQAAYKPVFSVRDLFVAVDSETKDRLGWGNFGVYRVENDGTITGAGRLIGPNGWFLYGHTIDSLDKSKVAVLWRGGDSRKWLLVIYQATETGLTEVKRKEIEDVYPGQLASYNYSGTNFAVAGDYLVYRDRTSRIIAEKDDRKLTVEPLPTDADGDVLTPHQVAISSSGKVMISAWLDRAESMGPGTRESSGLLYLYQINGDDFTNDTNNDDENGDQGNDDGDNNDNNEDDGNPSGDPSGSDSDTGGSPPPVDPALIGSDVSCSTVGGHGCTDTLEAGEIQLGSIGAHSCESGSYCVRCAEGYAWNGGGDGNCTLTESCEDVGGDGCTFRPDVGEQILGGVGAYGCSGVKPYCVRCTDGKEWNGSNCE